MSENFNSSARTKENPSGRVTKHDTERDRIGEIQDRLRRIETRLTAWMQKCGFDTHTQQAEWGPGYVNIPSVDIRLRDVLKAIPDEWDGDIQIVHAGEVVAVLTAYDPD